MISVAWGRPQLRLASAISDSIIGDFLSSSILSASAITFVFTWLIQWFLTRKVRSIDMVEALKSVE